MQDQDRLYQCLYNFEMLTPFTTTSPVQRYEDDVSDEHVALFVRDVAETDVDLLMICPTAWRTVLWPSAIEPRWGEEESRLKRPCPESDLKYYEKAYWRIWRYMIQGKDPVGLVMQTAAEIGVDSFFSYRMNDNHYVWDRAATVHPAFWRDNPQWQIDPAMGSPFNYLVPEVREHYLDLLAELVDMYDPSGLELDFQRSPRYFPEGEIDEGAEAMTRFVGDVRRMLDERSGEGKRRLGLCVRVPHRLELCEQIGLDVAAWDRAGLIDMVNISPHFISSLDLDIEGFRQSLKNVRLYGEMHYITQQRTTPAGFGNGIVQRTTRQQYRTMAFSYLRRGADGVSLFNFPYTREHAMAEPRRSEFPGCEPPVDVLKNICDAEWLAEQPKHYFLTDHSSQLPKTIPPLASAEIQLDISDEFGPECPHAYSLLRIETSEDNWRHSLAASVNGERLQEIDYVGELFVPFGREALPAPRHVRHFVLPIEHLHVGVNFVAVADSSVIGWYDPSGGLTLKRIEVALYPRPPFVDSTGQSTLPPAERNCRTVRE